MNEENKAFVKKMIDGDERAFDELYHSYSGKLYRMAYFITGNRSDSEDVLQETFVKCFLHRTALKDPERFESWICQILVRTAWKMEKSSRKKSEFSYEGILEHKEESGSRLVGRIKEDGAAPSPLEEVLRKEDFRELMLAVGQLDVKYRTIVLLYYFNELGVREIAEITGLFEGTVKSRLSKARKLLREALEYNGRKQEQGGIADERQLGGKSKKANSGRDFGCSVFRERRGKSLETDSPSNKRKGKGNHYEIIKEEDRTCDGGGYDGHRSCYGSGSGEGGIYFQRAQRE